MVGLPSNYEIKEKVGQYDYQIHALLREAEAKKTGASTHFVQKQTVPQKLATTLSRGGGEWYYLDVAKNTKREGREIAKTRTDTARELVHKRNGLVKDYRKHGGTDLEIKTVVEFQREAQKSFSKPKPQPRKRGFINRVFRRK